MSESRQLSLRPVSSGALCESSGVSASQPNNKYSPNGIQVLLYEEVCMRGARVGGLHLALEDLSMYHVSYNLNS